MEHDCNLDIICREHGSKTEACVEKRLEGGVDGCDDCISSGCHCRGGGCRRSDCAWCALLVGASPASMAHVRRRLHTHTETNHEPIVKCRLSMRTNT